MKRASNIEFLRILSIIFIVSHHLAYFTGYIESDNCTTRLISQAFNIWAYIGVNCFFMISGWFGLSQKKIATKLLKTYMVVWFYAVLILLIFVISIPEKVTFAEIIKSLLPITFSRWWFITTYFGMMVLSPFIIILINSLSKKKYVALMSICGSMLLVIHTVTTASPYYSNLFIACFYYMFAIGLKKHNILFVSPWKKIVKVRWFIASAIGIYISTVVFWIISMYVPAAAEGINFLTGIDTITIFVSSVILFGVIIGFPFHENRMVNFLGHHTLAIYIIQSNPLVANTLWPYIKSLNIENSPLFALYFVIIVLSICLFCVFFDCLREVVFNKVKANIILPKSFLKLLGYLDGILDANQK